MVAAAGARDVLRQPTGPTPDFAWAFASRFLLVMAYAFLVTYQAYYLIDRIGVPESEVAHQIYLGTLGSPSP